MAAVKKFHAACKAGPATCITAWDYPTGLLAKSADMDLILIGDSTAITALGLASTASITLDELIYHCRAVSRAAKGGPFLLGDLPLGSYEITPEQAVASALRLVKEGRVDGVKLEGGKELAPQVAAITKAGVPVVGHVGLTPQRALATLHIDGIDGVADAGAGKGKAELSFGSTVESAEMVLDDGLALQKVSPEKSSVGTLGGRLGPQDLARSSIFTLKPVLTSRIVSPLGETPKNVSQCDIWSAQQR